MNRHPLRRVTVLIALATVLGACAKRSEPVSSLGEDDDAICRGRGYTIGSNDYVACRKDRDGVRGNATARADRAQRNLGEMMLNNPEAGPRR